MHSKQSYQWPLPIASVCEFNYIHSNYNDIHYWTNPKISLIRTGAGPKLFGLVRFHCITFKNLSFRRFWDTSGIGVKNSGQLAAMHL